MTGESGQARLVPFRPERNATLDTVRWSRKRAAVPLMLEVDVTDAREAIREYRRRSGSGLSFTAWVVSCVARAAAEHPRVHALRQGRRRLALFDEVDVAVVVERAVEEPAAGEAAGDSAEAETLPMPVVVRGAERKSPGEIHEETGPDGVPRAAARDRRHGCVSEVRGRDRVAAGGGRAGPRRARVHRQRYDGALAPGARRRPDVDRQHRRSFRDRKLGFRG